MIISCSICTHTTFHILQSLSNHLSMIYFCVRHYVTNKVDVPLLLKDFQDAHILCYLYTYYFPHSVVIK